jgi:hypothetical protein
MPFQNPAAQGNKHLRLRLMLHGGAEARARSTTVSLVGIAKID